MTTGPVNIKQLEMYTAILRYCTHSVRTYAYWYHSLVYIIGLFKVIRCAAVYSLITSLLLISCSWWELVYTRRTAVICSINYRFSGIRNDGIIGAKNHKLFARGANRYCHIYIVASSVIPSSSRALDRNRETLTGTQPEYRRVSLPSFHTSIRLADRWQPFT